MKDFEITPLGEGRFLLSGEFNFDNVPSIWEGTLGLFSPYERVALDLSGIRRTTSAGLALLIEWLRLARSQGKALSYLNIPEQMQALIDVSDLEPILPIEQRPRDLTHRLSWADG